MIKYPDYNNSLVNLSASILKYYELPYNHNTLSYIDKYLEKKYKNIVILLCDGMGSYILEKHKNVTQYLLDNKIANFSSVFPPTTTAATTSLLSNLTPLEHGWLGWDVYIKNIDRTVTLYTNKIKDSEDPAAEYNVANKYFKFESIIEKIKTKNDSFGLFPFGENSYKNLTDLKNRIISLCNQKQDKFIYAYYENPDAFLHLTGTKSLKVHNELKHINKVVKNIVNKVNDTLIIVIADHGHIDSNYYTLIDYSNIYNLLERTTSIEPRACSFKIKNGMKDTFVKEFKNAFKDDFMLLTKEEVDKLNLFGIGTKNDNYDAAVGDFLAVAKSTKNIKYDYNSHRFLSSHAGITESEMTIPLIVIEKK